MDLQTVTRTLSKLTSALDKTIILPEHADVLRSFLSVLHIFLTNDDELFVSQRLSVSKTHTLYIEDNAEFLYHCNNRLRVLQAFLLSFISDNDKTSSVESARKSRRLFDEEVKIHVLRRAWILFNVEKIATELNRLVLDFYQFFAANVPFKGLHNSFQSTFEAFLQKYETLMHNRLEDSESLKQERLFTVESLVMLFPKNKFYQKFNETLQNSTKHQKFENTQIEILNNDIEEELRAETKNLLENLESEILQNLQVDVYDLKHLSFLNTNNSNNNKRMLRKTSAGSYNNGVVKPKTFQLAELKTGKVNKTVIARYVQTKNNLKYANKVSDLFSFLREVDVLKKGHENVLSPLGYSFLPNSDFNSLCFLYDHHKENITLEGHLTSNYKFNEVEVLTIGLSVSKALDFLHSQGLFHGKVSPANVWLCVESSTLSNGNKAEQTIIKLSDFDTDLPSKKKSVKRYENDILFLGLLLSQLVDVKPTLKLDNFVLDERLRKSISDVIEKCLVEEPHERVSSFGVRNKFEELVKIFKLDLNDMKEVVLGLIQKKNKGVNEEYASKFKQRQNEARQNRRSFRDVFRKSKVFAIEKENMPRVSEKKVSKQVFGPNKTVDVENRKSENFMEKLRSAFRVNYKKKSSQVSLGKKLSSLKDDTDSYNYRPKPKESLRKLRSQNFVDDELEFKKSVTNKDFNKSLEIFENMAVESVNDDVFEHVSSKESSLSGYESDVDKRALENVKDDVAHRMEKKKSEVIHSDDIIINTLFIEPATNIPIFDCLTGELKNKSFDEEFEEWEDVPRKRSNAILRLSKALKEAI